MSKAEVGSTVKVAYVGTLDDGTELERSPEGDDFEFTIGSQQVIPGFEMAVAGMEVGEIKKVRIEAEQAYGPHNEEAVAEVPRTRLPDNMEPSVGQRLKAQGEDGQPIVVTITEVTATTVTLDANHPLAGKDLTFEITLNEISGKEMVS